MARGFLDVPMPLRGGILRQLSNWDAMPGFWTLTGWHGNTEGDLTKWPGSALFISGAGSSRITGLFQSRLANSSNYFVMYGDTVARVDSNALIALLTGQTPTGFYDAKTIGQLFLFCNGLNPNRKILSDLRVQLLGVAAPASAPTVAAGAAGDLTGTYNYKRTFKNSTTQAESNPSPVSGDVTVTSKQITVTGLGGATDTQVDKQVLYRNTGTGAGQWFRVVELDASLTSYTDNITDANLAEQVYEDNGVPPLARFLETYNGMMVYAGLQSPNMNRVAFSGLGRPEAHDPDNVYDLDPESDDTITGMKVFGGALAIHKRHALYLASGYTPDTMTIVKTRVTHGAVSHWSIIDYASSHFYLGEQGGYRFAGMNEEYLGRPVEPIFNTLDLSAMANSTGVYYSPLQMLIWTLKPYSSSDFDTWLIYHVPTGQWSMRSYAASRLSIYLDSSNRQKLWIGATDGTLLVGDTGTADNGAAITADLITRGIGLKANNNRWDADQLYCFRHIELHYDPNGGTAPVYVSYCMDSPNGPFLPVVNPANGTNAFVPATGNRVRFDLGGYGRLLFLKVSTASTEPLVLHGLRVEGAALGRR